MEKRICPVCDREMKSRHYCHFCRSFVRRPARMNVTYYLNERHPAHETDCDFHAPTYKKNVQQRSVQPFRPSVSGRSFRPAAPNQPPGFSPPVRSSGTGQPARLAQSRSYAGGGSGKPSGRFAAEGHKTGKVPSIMVMITVSLLLISFFSILLPFLLFLL